MLAQILENGPPYTLLHAPPLLHRLEFHHEHWTNISIRVDEELSKKWRFWIFKLDEMHLVCMARLYHLLHIHMNPVLLF